MEIKVLKTCEIVPEYWKLIVDEFNKVYNTQKDIGTFKEYYERTPLGYSYHALTFDNSCSLAGYHSLIPILYKDSDGEDILIGLSGGAFVVQQYRSDVFIYSDMINVLVEFASKEGVVANIGVPNENAFQYALKFLNSTLISFLPYFVFPVRIFNILKIKNISFLNFISIFIAKSLLWSNLLFSKLSNSLEKEARFELKTDDQYYRNRFGNGNYLIIRLNGLIFYYRVVLEEGVRIIYLFDFRENEIRTFRALVGAVRYILGFEKPDLILFIGHLRIRQFLLFRVPRRFEPQPLPLTFNITSESFRSYFEAMSDESSWNFGLMNFDVR